MGKKVYMSPEGLRNLTERYKGLKEEIEENNKRISQAYFNGNGARENSEYEDLIMRGRVLASEISSLAEVINNSEVLDTATFDENTVNLEDIVELSIDFGSGDFEVITVKLTTTGNILDSDNVSINSPLGIALYGKKIGDFITYKIDNKVVVANILSKTKLEKMTLTKK